MPELAYSDALKEVREEFKRTGEPVDRDNLEADDDAIKYLSRRGYIYPVDEEHSEFKPTPESI